jgi:hypothetical protein
MPMTLASQSGRIRRPGIKAMNIGAVVLALAVLEPFSQTSAPVKTRIREGREGRVDFSSLSPAATLSSGATATRVGNGVSIDASRLRPRRILVQEMGGKEREVNQDSTFILQRDQVAIVQTGTAPISQNIVGRNNTTVPGFALPFQILSIDRQNKTRSFEVCVETGNGLSLHSGIPGYSGKIWMAIQDTENRQAAFELASPITVVLTGLGLEIAPEQIQFSKGNDYRDFKVSSLSPPDPATLRARLTGLPDDGASAIPVSEVPLPVFRPRLKVNLTSSAIAGFGLDETTVTVQASGYVTPDGQEVTLAAKGRPSQPVLKLNKQGFAETTLRSASIGEDSVRASTSEASGVSPVLEYLFPWAFFISTVLGALIGASIERLQSKNPSGTWARRLILGVLVGTAFTVLFAVGISNIQWISPVAKSGDAVIAAIALAGAFGGFRLVNLGGK